MATNFQDLKDTRAVPPDNKLSQQLVARNISNAQWHTLSKSLYPGARPESVLLVIDYCQARGLDPMKKPCHIVPMEVKDAKTNKYEWRDVVLPGIYELRITAHRTGEYGGHSKPEYGPVAKIAGVEAPEWCEMTFFRFSKAANRMIEFPVRVYFREAVALKDGKANKRWTKAPVQMLTKCTEAAGLREAFPDEIGGQQTEEEVSQGVTLDLTPSEPVAPPDDAPAPTDGQQEPTPEPQDERSPTEAPESEAQKRSAAKPRAVTDRPVTKDLGKAPETGALAPSAPPEQLNFSQAMNAIARAKTVEDLDVIRSQITDLKAEHQEALKRSIKIKADSFGSGGLNLE